jgi:hypothetical protein
MLKSDKPGSSSPKESNFRRAGPTRVGWTRVSGPSRRGPRCEFSMLCGQLRCSRPRGRAGRRRRIGRPWRHGTGSIWRAGSGICWRRWRRPVGCAFRSRHLPPPGRRSRSPWNSRSRAAVGTSAGPTTCLSDPCPRAGTCRPGARRAEGAPRSLCRPLLRRRPSLAAARPRRRSSASARAHSLPIFSTNSSDFSGPGRWEDSSSKMAFRQAALISRSSFSSPA